MAGERDRALAGARAQGDLELHNWACFGAEQHYGEADAAQAFQDAAAILRWVDAQWEGLLGA